MSEPFIGQISIFGFDYPPRGYSFCDGTLLPIMQNEALYSIFLTTYGGDGASTFALPDLRGRVPIQQDGMEYCLGDKGGDYEVALPKDQLPPSHTHTVNASSIEPTKDNPNQKTPEDGFPGYTPIKTYCYPYDQGSMVAMNEESVLPVGFEYPLPHINIQPSLPLNFCVALTGLYPPRS